MEAQEHDTNAIAAYIEGRLEGDEKARFTAHLASCAECRGTLALLARESDALGVSTKESEPRDPSIKTPFRPWAPALRVLLPMAAGLVIISAVAFRAGWFKPAPRVTYPELSPRTEIDDLLVKRGAERRIGGKTFRLVAGEWRDTAFDSLAGLPLVEVEGLQQRSELLSRVPALAPYAELGPRVLVVFEGNVYRFRPSSP